MRLWAGGVGRARSHPSGRAGRAEERSPGFPREFLFHLLRDKAERTVTGPTAELPRSWRPVPVRKAAGAHCGAPGQSRFRFPLHVPEAPEVCISVNTRFTAASPQTQSDLRLFLVIPTNQTHRGRHTRGTKGFTVGLGAVRRHVSRRGGRRGHAAHERWAPESSLGRQ